MPLLHELDLQIHPACNIGGIDDYMGRVPLCAGILGINQRFVKHFLDSLLTRNATGVIISINHTFHTFQSVEIMVL